MWATAQVGKIVIDESQAGHSFCCPYTFPGASGTDTSDVTLCAGILPIHEDEMGNHSTV
jgi:hypothetical protein